MMNQILVDEIKKLGFNPEKVEKQIKIFKADNFHLKLDRSCSINDGIYCIKRDEREDLKKYFYSALKENRVSKFVPASGAASRMFKSLIATLKCFPNLTKNDLDENSISLDKDLNETRLFFDNLWKFAFMRDLKESFTKKKLSLEEAYRDGNYALILDLLLTEKGLDFLRKPKAVIPFHQCLSKCPQTALEEQINEMLALADKHTKLISIHFTTQEESQSDFRKIVLRYEQKYPNYDYHISYSKQLHTSNTIAVDMKNDVFRKSNGDLLFRPSGHGALIQNLNMLKADIVFIKTIDNILINKIDTVSYKVLLAGLLLKIQTIIFSLLRAISNGIEDSNEITDLLLQLSVYLSFDIEELKDDAMKIEFIRTKLNRPIRVCGMVKNIGDAGGGPFWVKEKNNSASLQIVEKAQINMAEKAQVAILKNASHFNPVEIVCGLRDFKGSSFDLNQFIEHSANFVSEKSFNGNTFKALELPGLWNGAMAKWLTFFVDMPLSTFSPVKTITDLLKKEHC